MSRTIVVGRARVVDPNVKRLTLPLPPSINAYWRAVGIWVTDKRTGEKKPGAKVILSREGRAYKERAELLGRAQCKGILDGPCEVWLKVYLPSRRADHHNYTKALLDSLQDIAYENDRQVESLHTVRKMDRECPRIEIEIRRYTPEP